MRPLPLILMLLLGVSCQAETPAEPDPVVSSFRATLPGSFKRAWESGDKVSVVSLSSGSIATVDSFTAQESGASARFSGTYTGAAKAQVLVVYPAMENVGGQVFESAPLFDNESGYFRAVKGTGYFIFAPKDGMRFLQKKNADASALEAMEFLVGGSSAESLFAGSVSLQSKMAALRLELNTAALGKEEKVRSLTLSVDEGTPFTSYRGSLSLDAARAVWTTNEARSSFAQNLGGFTPDGGLTLFVPVFPNGSGASLSGTAERTLMIEVKTNENTYAGSQILPAGDKNYELTGGREIGISATLTKKIVNPVDEPVIKSVTKIMDKGPSGLYLNGSTLFVGAGGIIYAMDVSNPREPVLIGSVTFPGSVRQITYCNGKLVASARETGVWVFDASDPAHMSLLSRYDGIELSTGIDMAGDCIFVGERQTGVEFVDARNLAKPQHIRVIKTPESQTVFYQDGYLYSGEWAAGQVSIFDAHNLADIQLVKTLYLQGYGDGVWVSGNRLYASTGHHHRNSAPKTVDGDGHGVEIWDVSNPREPEFISRVEFDIFYISGADWWLVRPSGDGKTLFCGDVFNGLYIVDITNERKPKIIHHWEPLGNSPTNKKNAVNSIALADGVAFVTVSGEGLYAIESPRSKPSPRNRGTAPTNLSARYTYETPATSHFNAWVPDRRGAVKSAAVYGDALFVGCGDAGLYTVKKNSSGKLETVARLDIPFAGGVAINGDKLYVSRGHLGLGVYRIGSDLSLTEIALLKQELNPSKPADQFSYWVSAPNDKYVVNGVRRSGYQFLAVGGTADKPAYTMRRQYNLNVNYNRYISEKTSTEGYLPYATRSGLAWINLNNTASVSAPVVYENLKNNLTEGATLYKNNQFLLTRSHAFCTIAPGGEVILETSEANDAFSGIPRWESGNQVLVCNFVNRFVSKVNTANFASPTLMFTESTLGYPEPGLFWKGKCVVPCGYQGLLIEK